MRQELREDRPDRQKPQAQEVGQGGAREQAVLSSLVLGSPGETVAPPRVPGTGMKRCWKAPGRVCWVSEVTLGQTLALVREKAGPSGTDFAEG